MFAARLAIAVMLCVSFSGGAEEPAAKPAASRTEAKPDAATAAEFKPPPGFRAKKRGDAVVYCRKETELGSRFAGEKCYDQAGLAELKRAELEHTEMLEKIRACGTGSCSAN